MTRPTILIVEDEPLIRMCAVDFAEDSGYAAIEAKDAAEALAVLEQGAAIDLLFTDITLPGAMDGLALTAEVSTRWPEMPVMLASGGLAGLAADVAPGAWRLAKPYGFSQFRAALNQCCPAPALSQ